MAKVHINPNNRTNRTIDAIDRKRERERRFMLNKARENSADLSIHLVQRLLDQHIIETNANGAIQEVLEKQLRQVSDMEEFEIQYKVAPIRELTQDPNLLSLYITQYIVEDLIDHPNIQDVFGDDLDVYRAVDSVLSVLRP
jgi:hypothetical protein